MNMDAHAKAISMTKNTTEMEAEHIYKKVDNDFRNVKIDVETKCRMQCMYMMEKAKLVTRSKLMTMYQQQYDTYNTYNTQQKNFLTIVIDEHIKRHPPNDSLY